MTQINLTFRLEDSGSGTEPLANAGWLYRVRNSKGYVNGSGDYIPAAWAAGGGWKPFNGATVTLDLDPLPADNPYLLEVKGPIDPTSRDREPFFLQEYRQLLVGVTNGTSWFSLPQVSAPADLTTYPEPIAQQLAAAVANLQAQINAITVSGGGASNLAGITDMSAFMRTVNDDANAATARTTLGAAPAGTGTGGAVRLADVGITGTPTGAKYLRDDGTWQTVSGTVAGSVAWADVTSKPTVFTPDTHTHVPADVTGVYASPALTGTPTAPTAAGGTNTTQIATTAFVLANGGAGLASPAFTGTPTAPTASAGTSTTQIATTAFVRGNVETVANAAPGTVIGITWAGSGTPNRTTTRTDIRILWIGPNPDPPVVSSGTAGMYDGDLRARTAF